VELLVWIQLREEYKQRLGGLYLEICHELAIPRTQMIQH
jgi:hypothetical protein